MLLLNFLLEKLKLLKNEKKNEITFIKLMPKMISSKIASLF